MTSGPSSDNLKSRDPSDDRLRQALSAYQHIFSRFATSDSNLDFSVESELRNAVSRLIDDAANSHSMAQQILETGCPQDLLAYLRDRREKLLKARTELLDRVREEEIKLDHELAAVAYVTGQIEVSETALNRILEKIPNDIEAHGRLGKIQALRGDLFSAEKQYNLMLKIDNSDSTRAVVYSDLGDVEHVRGNLDVAKNYFEKSLEINEKLGLRVGVAKNLGNLGLIEQTRGNLEQAERYHKRSLEIEESLGRREGMASQLGNLGVIEQTRGNIEQAERYHKRSLEINEALGHKQGMANQLGNLGVIEQTRGNIEQAERYHKRSLEINESLGRKEGMASDLGNLGLIEVKRGNASDARANWTRSRDLYDQIGMPHMVQRVQELIDSLQAAD